MTTIPSDPCPSRSHPLAVQLGYSAGNLGKSVIWTSFESVMLFYLVTIAGFAPLSAGMVLAVALLAATRGFWDPDHSVFWAGVAFLGFLQLTALVLNLLPIPGLDGFGALEPHLSPSTRRSLEPVRQFGFLILIVVLMTPVLNQWFFRIVFWFFDLSGVPAGLAMFGGQLTRFWSAWL